jgi:hypothetical protein
MILRKWSTQKKAFSKRENKYPNIILIHKEAKLLTSIISEPYSKAYKKRI